MFTREQFGTFFRLVNMCGSNNQMRRINGRLNMGSFVEEAGRDKCDRMFALINEGVTPSTLTDEQIKGE
jgi:hypothetical protein